MPVKEKEKSLKDLIGQSLKDFIFAKVYLLELDHGLMGCFPAIRKDDGQIVATADEELIEKIWKLLTPRKAKILVQLALINRETNEAYCLNNIDKYVMDYNLHKREVIHLITPESLARDLASTKTPYKWAPGLIGDGMTLGEFRDTLKSALEQGSQSED